MSTNNSQERICTTVGLENINTANLTSKDADKVTAAFYKKKLWSANSTINVKFTDLNPTGLTITPLSKMDTSNSPIDPIQQEYFEKPDSRTIPQWIEYIVSKRLQPIVNLTFNFNMDSEWDDTEKSDNTVVISFKSGSAWSLVGTDVNSEENKGTVTMNLGWFDVGTVLHEFGHVLGLVHEHQNPRGPIDWNDKKVYQYYENDPFDWSEEKITTNIIQKYDKDQINGSEFDPCSIMLYFFPASLTNNGISETQNLRLSGTDIEYIMKTYPPNTQITSAQIFNQFYGGDIEENIKACNAKRSLSFGGKILFYLKKYWYIPVIIIFLIGGIIIAIFLIKKKGKYFPNVLRERKVSPGIPVIQK